MEFRWGICYFFMTHLCMFLPKLFCLCSEGKGEGEKDGGKGVIEKVEGAEMTEWEGTWVWICEKIDG